MLRIPLIAIALVSMLPLSLHAQSSAGEQGLERIVPPSPAPAGFVADVAGVLEPGQRDAANARIASVQAAGRGDIGVAVVPDIGDYQPYEVGVAIYRSWGIGSVAEIGSARRDVGALLLIVPKELAPDGRGHCWITTGRGAEGMLTDGVVAEICRELVVPRLRERDYGAAILAGVDGIDRVLQGDAALALAAETGAESPSGGGLRALVAVVAGIVGSVGAAIAAVVGFRRYRRRRPRRCPACGGAMHRLDEAADDAYLDHGQLTEERVKSVDYDVWLCGACGTQRPERYAKWITSYVDCPACGAKTARTKRRVIDAATTTHTGAAEDTTSCEACGHRGVATVTLPIVVASSSGGGSGGGSSGGSSFGGSGSTSGGGGGSSY